MEERRRGAREQGLVDGFGFNVPAIGFRVPGSRSRASIPGFQVPEVGFQAERASRACFRVQGE